jgi:hypothetical protein
MGGGCCFALGYWDIFSEGLRSEGVKFSRVKLQGQVSRVIEIDTPRNLTEGQVFWGRGQVLNVTKTCSSQSRRGAKTAGSSFF